jgi:hypothetical protein
VKKKMR